MKTTRDGWNDWVSSASLVLLGSLSIGVASCIGAPEQTPATSAPPAFEELPVIQVLAGEWDGEELTFRTLQPSELGGVPADDVAGASAPLLALPSMNCTTCTGVSYVAFSNGTGKRAITNGAVAGTAALWTSADAGNCGATPTTGVCQQVRMRNLYTQQLERVYARVTALTATGSSTAATFQSSPFTAVSDYGLSAGVANGLFRAGEIGRSSSASGLAQTWWPFIGSTPAGMPFRFSFTVEVHGLVVNATQRASLANGLLDAPASDYPARTTVAPVSPANIGTSLDGRYVAFASGASSNQFVYRKDMTTGALVAVNAVACTSATNPHISGDGSTVVFQASGCDLTAEGSTTSSPQIYAYDFNTLTMTLVTRSTTGGYAGSTSQQARVSEDGNVVVFHSAATNLVDSTPVRAGCTEVYRFDRSAATMIHVSALRFSDIFDPSDDWIATCNGSNFAGQEPDVSADGNFVAFTSVLALDTADTNAKRDIYVYDQAASDGSGVVISYRVSLSNAGAQITGTTGSTSPSMSPDGTYVAFASDATNVIGGETTSGRQIYRRSSAEGSDSTILRATRRVDDGLPTGTTAGIPALSSTGRFVAFWSAATNLASVSGVFTYAGTQLHVCDMDAPVASLQRCWVASTLQPTSAGAFAVLTGSTAGASRIGIAYASDIDAGYVVYQAAPTSGWGTANGGGQQIFVSPVGDPRYQQAVVTP